MYAIRGIMGTKGGVLATVGYIGRWEALWDQDLELEAAGGFDLSAPFLAFLLFFFYCVFRFCCVEGEPPLVRSTYTDYT